MKVILFRSGQAKGTNTATALRSTTPRNCDARFGRRKESLPHAQGVSLSRDDDDDDVNENGNEKLRSRFLNKYAMISRAAFKFRKKKEN